MPIFEETPLLVFRLEADARVWVNSSDVKIEPIGLFSRVLSGLRKLARSVRRATLHFNAIEVRPDGSKKKTLRYRKLVKFARTSNMSFDGDLMHRHPELVYGWPDYFNKGTHISKVETTPIAVVVHLHYLDLWPEIAELLSSWPTSFELFVTITNSNEGFEARLREQFPDCNLERVENRGRDVRPFLSMLENGVFEHFDIVCKIHGKRSRRPDTSPLFGELFRRATYLDLVEAGQVRKIIALFNTDPKLGIVGPERFRASSRHGRPGEIMGASRGKIETLTARMAGDITIPEYDVFSGTMFWVRPQALEPLRRLALAKDGFAPEAGLSDGGLEHAVEGLFNHSVRIAGFSVTGVSGGD